MSWWFKWFFFKLETKCPELESSSTVILKESFRVNFCSQIVRRVYILQVPLRRMLESIQLLCCDKFSSETEKTQSHGMSNTTLGWIRMESGSLLNSARLWNWFSDGSRDIIGWNWLTYGDAISPFRSFYFNKMIWILWEYRAMFCRFIWHVAVWLNMVYAVYIQAT